MQVKRYKRDFDYSYTLGAYPTLELLRHRPNDVQHVFARVGSDANAGVSEIQEICSAKSIPFEVSDKTLNRIAQREDIQVLAVFGKFETSLAANRNHLMLVRPADFGNLGACVRTALGMDVEDIAILSPGADIFNPQALRASMGAVFRASIAYFASLDDYRSGYGHALYPFFSDGEASLDQADFTSPWCLAFGPEGAGLPENFRQAGITVSIPQSANVDSLNLTVAVGIGLYAANRSTR